MEKIVNLFRWDLEGQSVRKEGSKLDCIAVQSVQGFVLERGIHNDPSARILVYTVIGIVGLDTAGGVDHGYRVTANGAGVGIDLGDTKGKTRIIGARVFLIDNADKVDLSA